MGSWREKNKAYTNVVNSGWCHGCIQFTLITHIKLPHRDFFQFLLIWHITLHGYLQSYERHSILKAITNYLMYNCLDNHKPPIKARLFVMSYEREGADLTFSFLNIIIIFVDITVAPNLLVQTSMITIYYHLKKKSTTHFLRIHRWGNYYHNTIKIEGVCCLPHFFMAYAMSQTSIHHHVSFFF